MPSSQTVSQIIQLEIAGPSVKTAWNSNLTTRQLESDCPQSSNWTPAQPGGLSVFHGTDAQFRPERGFKESLSEFPFRALTRQFDPNQIAPSRVGAIYTAFSPLRCFMWALFKAEVIQSIPSQSRLNHANQSWSSNGVNYRGLAVLQFASSQPQPASLTSHTIARDTESAWFDRTRNLEIERSHDFISYAQFTQDTVQTTYLDLIHGLEMSDARTQLMPYTRNHWRTVWTSDRARDILNANHLTTYAIALNITANVDPKFTKNKGAINDRKEGSGKRASMRRTLQRVTQKLSGGSLREKGKA